MKRTIALVLVLAICLSTMSLTVSATESVITVDKVTGNPGEQVEIKVSISGNTGLAYLKIKIGYDSDVLTLVSAENSGLLEGTYTTSKTTDVNPYVLQWMGAGNSVGDGVIATLTFTIAETAEVGDTEITISFEECYDEEYNDVIFDTSAGSVTVECAHTNKTEVPSKSPDCDETGNHLYYVCDTCGAAFAADGVTETTVEAETIPALGHDWGEADCDTPATCGRCGATNGEALGHSFTNYVSNNDATCTADGTKTAKCDRCDETSTVTDEGSALGHDWVDADCDTPKTCERCGATEGEALGHNYSTEWSVGENGHWHECAACGDKTDAGEHDFGTEGDSCVVCDYERSHVHRLTLVQGVDATCTEAGNKPYYTCSGCEDWFEDASGSVLIENKSDVVIAVLGHDMTDATCTEDAYCQREGCDYVEEGSALGHSFTEYISNDDATCTEDGTKTAKCDRCDETDTVTDVGSALGHDWVDADCNTPKTCSVCGEIEGEALGHSFTNYVYNNDATCTEDGTKTAKCDRCEEVDTVTAEGTMTEHDYADATCTAPKTCNDCGITEGEALGHDYSTEWSAGQNGHWHDCSRCDSEADFDEHDFADGDVCVICEYERDHVHRLTLVEGDEATCTEGGTKPYYTCSGCEDWFEDASGAVLIEDKASVVVSALGHDLIDATCTEDAYCQREGCDYVEENSVLGHSFTDYVSDENATCTEDGTKTAKCDRCDETDTVADEGSALGHDWVDADCDSPKTCSQCGLTEGEALGHTWVDATCTEPKTCETCGETEGEALGHDFQDGICSVCGEEEEIEEPEEPNWWNNWFEKWFGSWWGDDEEEECEHSYTSVVTAPSCTEKGYTTHTCELCGDSYTDSYVAATGHDYENNVCTVCGHKKSGWFFWFDWFWKK